MDEMSESGGPIVRTITIEIRGGNNFTVREGDRYVDRLGWDEMLGTVAELTHPRIGQARYRMRTATEHREERDRREARMAAFRAARAAAALVGTGIGVALAWIAGWL